MNQNRHHSLAATVDQPSARPVAVTIPPINRQHIPSVTPKPSPLLNRKRQPCTLCQRATCYNGSACKNDHAPSPSDQGPFPTGLTRRPSVDSHRGSQPRRPRTNRVLSLTIHPSVPPTIPQNSQKPRTMRKISDPSASIPVSQPKRPPSRAGAPEHTGSSIFPQHNPHGRGRMTSGPPPVIPKPQQRRARSRSSTREQDPIFRQSPPRRRPDCRGWLKGNCPEGSNCPFTHDPEARAADEFRSKKVAEEQAAKATREAAATVHETVLPSTKVSFGAGITVKEVLAGYETCRVSVKNLPLTATKAEVIALFTQPGFHPEKFTVHPPRPSQSDRSHLEAVVEFEDLEDGKNAVAGLDEIEFGPEKLRFAITSKQGGMEKSKERNLNILTVTWPAPSGRTTRNYNLNYSIPSLQTLVIEALPDNFGATTWEPNLVPNQRGLVSVKIHFPTWEHAKSVHDFLDQKPLPLCPHAKCFVSLPDPFHYAIHLPYSQFKAQERLFRSLIPVKNDRKAAARLRILPNQPDRPARIELSGSDKKTIGRLKVRIEQLIAGEKLPQWDRVFYGAEGETFLKKVNRKTRAYVRADKRQGVLKAFGDPAAVERAKAMIQGEVEKLASLQFEVFLKRASVRFFVDGARGSTLLKQEVGEENVTLDVSSVPCKIVVRGGESARHCLHKLIGESLSYAVRSQHQRKDGETCPVCYDMIDQPYRLACGHAYCYGCLRHLLLNASDTKRFPLSCIGDEAKCGTSIPLPVIQRFLLPAQFKHLLEASFLEYLGHHPDKFRYCTTPDCPEIYSLESGSGDGIFRCRSCLVTVCASCREEHEGFSCEEWKIHRDPEAQETLLEGWAEGNNDVKKCPGCEILIEKNGGCNHMICPKCSAHICWKCMGVFPEDGIYYHMELVHGSIEDQGGVLFEIW